MILLSISSILFLVYLIVYRTSDKNYCTDLNASDKNTCKKFTKNRYCTGTGTTGTAPFPPGGGQDRGVRVGRPPPLPSRPGQLGVAAMGIISSYLIKDGS